MRTYKVQVADTETGCDREILIRAGSAIEAEVRAHQLGLLTTGTPDRVNNHRAVVAGLVVLALFLLGGGLLVYASTPAAQLNRAISNDAIYFDRDGRSVIVTDNITRYSSSRFPVLLGEAHRRLFGGNSDSIMWVRGEPYGGIIASYSRSWGLTMNPHEDSGIRVLGVGKPGVNFMVWPDQAFIKQCALDSQMISDRMEYEKRTGFLNRPSLDEIKQAATTEPGADKLLQEIMKLNNWD